MISSSRRLCTIIMLLFMGLASTTALAGDDDRRRLTILDRLVNTDGAQAVVAAVLVVDEAGVLDFSLARLLDKRRAKVVLLAPSNAAFEKLLGLPAGALNGLSIDEIRGALPGLLPMGVGPTEVASILLKHASLPKRANLRSASEVALLQKGKIKVADGSVFPVGVGSSGVQINYETTIIRANIVAKNGVIHFIDTVIVDGLL